MVYLGLVLGLIVLTEYDNYRAVAKLSSSVLLLFNGTLILFDYKIFFWAFFTL
jgi:hypothetical protein